METLMHKHASKPRNLNIASVFYKAGFIEAWGRGYKKIQDGFNEAKLPIPVFATAFGGIEVNIARPRTIESGGQNGGQNAAQLTERQCIIYDFIKRNVAVDVYYVDGQKLSACLRCKIIKKN